MKQAEQKLQNQYFKNPSRHGVFFRKIGKGITRCLIYLGEGVYLSWIRPGLSGSCRFHPTCFPYAKQAFLSFSVGKALCLTVHRVMRCHPWGEMGEDPLPSNLAPKKGKFNGKA